jgi:electron-transferring-flavoprotein dehydrogenase
MERESMEFDVLIVGGGPSGLAAAIRLKQLAAAAAREISVCLIEKGSELGAHTLSGAVIDPKGLSELLPDWQAQGAPLTTQVTEDRFMFLSREGSFRVPDFALLPALRNHGNYIGSLGQLVRWLGEQAEALGVEIYPGFAGSEVLYDADDHVIGVATGDMGRLHDGSEGPNFQRGMALLSRYTLFAEGCRGQLGKELEAKFNLREGVDPQTYGLGIKELWEVPAAQHQPGLVVHTAGWPLNTDTYGGSFLYHYGDSGGNTRVAVGFVLGLGYSNPHISAFEEFQRYKTHPVIRPHLQGGKRLAYGARALAAGGLQSLPKLTFPGGALIGDDAGFLHAARIKGTHTAIKSGMLAAEAAFAAIGADRRQDELSAYPEAFRSSWLHAELHSTRNFKPWMSKGLVYGTLAFGLEQKLFGGKAPWTLHNHADHSQLKPAATSKPIDYPKPDGVLSFDRPSSVFLSNTHHEEDQPCHLQLRNPAVPIGINYEQFDAPEQRYCPAGVYEIVRDGQPTAPRLQINAQNCVHCKSCDIKDPTQNITWVSPQGGEGPIYSEM